VSQSSELSARDPRGNEQWDSKGKQRKLLFFFIKEYEHMNQNNENSSNKNKKEMQKEGI